MQDHQTSGPHASIIGSRIMGNVLIHSETPRAFDAAASSYDATYETLEGIKKLRSLTMRTFLKFFHPGERLLELNCGTGTDAVTLAKHGMTVLATDSSPLMLEEADKKIDREDCNGKVQTQLVPFEDLHTLSGKRFDGVYSNMGGLNCTNNLPPLAHDLAVLLRPNGYFIAIVMPSFCLWETLAFAARAQWKHAFRRHDENGCLAHLHGGFVQTYYHSPRKFHNAMSHDFDLVEVRGLNIFTPPPNSDRAYSALAGIIPYLHRLDELVSGFRPFSGVGDHYIMVLRRKAS